MTQSKGYREALRRIRMSRENSTFLDLSRLQLDDVPPEIGALTTLQTLNLSGNQLTTRLTEVSALTSLQTLILYNNQLTTLPTEIRALAALRRLDLRNNQLATVPNEISALTTLQSLDLAGNQLATLPKEIAALVALQKLDLRDNQLTHLPTELRRLDLLEQLYLHGNSGLQLSPEVLGVDPAQTGYDPQKANSPRSILDAYFTRQSGVTRPLNEVKLILVGRGGAGKTSIARALRGQPFRADESSTAGIALSDCIFTECRGGPVTAHIWDFAGQVITHALHQFFFSVRSVYILVLSGRENNEREDAEYWLRLINAFGTDERGQGPPVLIALNKWDLEGCRPRVDRGALQERYPNIRGFIEVDCKSKRGIPKLKVSLTKEIGKLKWVREPFKEAWDDVRRELSKSRGPTFISYADFRKLCERSGVPETGEQDSLAEILHNLGAALNYRNDPRLREATVLRPAWLTQNVYSLMRRAEKEAGALKKIDVDTVLARVRDEEMRDYLMRLMERFEIAYPARTREMWIVPQALPDEQPQGAEIFGAESDATRLRYVYTALPEGLVARAVVRLHEFIEETRGKKRQWAGGAILTRDGARALLRTEPQDRLVVLTVIGPGDARRQLAGLCQTEMREIHAEIPGLNPREETQVEGEWVSVKQLEADERDGRQTGFGKSSAGTAFVNPQDVNDAYSKKEARDEEVWKPSAFLGYSKRNIPQRKRLELELKVLRKEGLLGGSFYDGMIESGDEWDARIQRELSERDLILFLITVDSLATDYIVEREIPMAMRRHEAGEAVVVPVILEDCRWEKTVLGKLQVLPDKGKAINRWKPQPSAWKAVADGLAKVLQRLQKRGLAGRERQMEG